MMNKTFPHLLSLLYARHLPGIALSMLLLVLLPWNVLAQATEIYEDDFSAQKVTSLNVKQGSFTVASGILKAASVPDGKGYDGYAVTNTAVEFVPGFSYTISITAGAVVSSGKLEITEASTQADAAKGGAQRLLATQADNVVTTGAAPISTTFSVSSPRLSFIGLYVVSDAANAGMELDNLVITKSCIAPEVLLTAFNLVCKNSPAFDLSGGWPAGGTYTINGVAATRFDPATASEGDHTVVYTYTNEYGCSNTATQTITVTPLPVATILPEDASTPRTQCMATISFTYFSVHSNASAGSTLAWTVEKELTTADNVQIYYPDPQNPTIIVEGTGTVTVRLTAKDECGNTDDEFVTLEVVPLPDAPQNVTLPEEGERCGPGVVTLKVSGAAEGAYRWYREDGTLVDGVTGSVYSPNLVRTTNYYVASLNLQTGCESPNKVPVTGIINPVPIATVNILKSQCSNLDPSVPQTFELIGSRNVSGEIKWEVLDKDESITGLVISDESSLTPIVHVYGSGGVILRLTITSDKGCGSSYADAYLRVIPPAIANGTITINPDKPIPGKPATFSIQSSIIDNRDVNSLTWFYTIDGVTWKELPAREELLTLESVPADLVSVRVDIRPRDFEPTACYTNLVDGVYSVEAANIALPVEIIYLQANKQGSSVVLSWATAQERNNKGFYVQVSADGQKYEDLGFVETKNGNSAMKQVYTFTDRENGMYGTRYYRLKQVDEDGTTAYFGPKTITFGATGNQITAYPNPFNSEINLEIEAAQAGSVTITLTNAVGKQLLQRKVPVQQGANTEKLLLETQLPHGIYFIHTQMGSQHNSFKMLK